MRVVRRGLVILALGSVLLTACGSGGSSGGATIREAGQAEQKLEGGSDPAGKTGDTVPVAEKEKAPAMMRLGGAFSDFQDCLDEKGQGDADLTNAQQNFEQLDPALQDALGSCANKTGIVELMKEVEKENASLTPAEIKQRNVGFTAFRKCAVRHGWQWGELRPDKNGLLSMTASDPPVPPEGEKLSGLIDACQGEAADAAAKAAPES